MAKKPTRPKRKLPSVSVQIPPAAGLTRSELATLRALENAWNSFIKLDVQHPDDIEEFRRSLHHCQHLIGIRVARRAQPSYWHIEPTHA